MTVDAVSALDLSYTPLLGSPWDAVQSGAQAQTRRGLCGWGSSGLLSLHQENTTITTCAAGIDGSAQCMAAVWNRRGHVTKYTDDSSNFGADGPFFRIIREGLKGLADGEDYFDLLADDVVFEYVISVPGYPKQVEGRQNIIDLYSDYDSFMTVSSADNLHVYRDPAASVVVLEYEVHGESVQTGRPYDNRFVSIVTIRDGKVTRWRDYLDPVAVFDATGWPGRLD